MKQAVWQIYLPPPKYIPRPKFDVHSPNTVHQADLIFLTHDKVGRKTYKYALVVVDIASRYKDAEPLQSKYANEVAKAFESIYKRGPLKYPKLIQVDPGKEFMGAVTTLFNKHNVKIRRGEPNNHRAQAIVERANRTLAEKLYSFQEGQDLHNKTDRNRTWVKRLPKVLEAMNNQITRLLGETPADAIKKNYTNPKTSAPAHRPQGLYEKILHSGTFVRYLYQHGEIESGNRRATDPIWSVSVFTIRKALVYENEPVLYYLAESNAPKRTFVREELLPVPKDSELPPKEK